MRSAGRLIVHYRCDSGRSLLSDRVVHRSVSAARDHRRRIGAVRPHADRSLCRQQLRSSLVILTVYLPLTTPSVCLGSFVWSRIMIGPMVTPLCLSVCLSVCRCL